MGIVVIDLQSFCDSNGTICEVAATRTVYQGYILGKAKQTEAR